MSKHDISNRPRAARSLRAPYAGDGCGSNAAAQDGLTADHEKPSTARNLVRIVSFGGLSVTRGGLRPVPVASVRQRQLLRWLILAPWGPPLDVAVVCDALWPHADGAAAASNFASAVRRLRAALGDPATVLVEGGTVALNAHCCQTDLDILRQLPGRLSSTMDAAEAVGLANTLLNDFEGENSVLLAQPTNTDMVQRIQSAGIAWRQAILRLAELLKGGAHASLVLRLCERIERHGLADERIMAQWRDLACHA